MTYFYIIGFYSTTVFIAWQEENCSGNGRGGGREEWSGEEDEWARGVGRGAESCAVEQEWGRQGEGSGGANNACNFWGRVVRESPVLYDFVYYKAIFMEL